MFADGDVTLSIHTQSQWWFYPYITVHYDQVKHLLLWPHDRKYYHRLSFAGSFWFLNCIAIHNKSLTLNELTHFKYACVGHGLSSFPVVKFESKSVVSICLGLIMINFITRNIHLHRMESLPLNVFILLRTWFRKTEKGALQFAFHIRVFWTDSESYVVLSN